jgi:hypothetical protein
MALEPNTLQRLIHFGQLVDIPSSFTKHQLSKQVSNAHENDADDDGGLALFYSMSRKDGHNALHYWRSTLTHPFSATALSFDSMIIPDTIQHYTHSFLKAGQYHGCGFRMLTHCEWSSSLSKQELHPWITSSSNDRDVNSARLLVKAVHSANEHFDDESSYREIKVNELYICTSIPFA